MASAPSCSSQAATSIPLSFSCSRCSSSVAGSPVWKQQPIPTSPCSALPTVQSAASTFPSRLTGLDGFLGRLLADFVCLATTAISPCPMPSSALWCFWCSSFFCVCLCRKSRAASRATMRCNSVLAAPVFSAIPISSSVSRPCSATWPPKPASTVFSSIMPMRVRAFRKKKPRCGSDCSAWGFSWRDEWWVATS